MEQNEKVNITLTKEVLEGLAGKPLEIKFDNHNTEHNAPTLNEKVKFSEHVTLSSIDEWIKKREFASPINKNTAIITYCIHQDNPSVRFDENPNDKLATTLTSKLLVNPDYTDFRINNSSIRFSQKNLTKFLREKAHCFQNLEDVKDLIKRLQNFEIRYTQTVKATDNRQGETENACTTAIKAHAGEISGDLLLKMPLFLGAANSSFNVQIEIDKGENNMPEFSFHSLETQMLLMDSAYHAVMTEVEKFKDRFVCLEIEQ